MVSSLLTSAAVCKVPKPAISTCAVGLQVSCVAVYKAVVLFALVAMAEQDQSATLNSGDAKLPEDMLADFKFEMSCDGLGDVPGTAAAQDVSDDEDNDEGPDHDPELCACCQAELRQPRNIYGLECKRALNNIDKQEAKATNKKGERWDKWCELKRNGGPRLFGILLGYRRDCGDSKGSGNSRGDFDFMVHYEEVQTVASVGGGEKLLYMPFTKWIRVAAKDFGIDAAEAKKRWEKKEKNLPEKQKLKIGKVLLMPMPYQIYLVGENKKNHVQGMRFEKKPIKAPTEDKVADIEKQIDTGSLNFDDKIFSKVGGGELADNARSGCSALVAPNGESMFGRGENFRHATWPRKPKP